MTTRTALVAFYSQTGHTRAYARVVGAELREAGLTVHIVDYRDLDELPALDLLVVGTPVFYADVPSNLVAWVRSLPDLHGTSAAAFSCFGGHGDGQEHTAHALLRLLVERGGRPVGAAWFGAMSTFAPTWSMGNEARTLRYRHMPDDASWERARAFARQVLGGRTREPVSRLGKDSLLRMVPQVALNRRAITGHRVDRGRCTDCGLCEKRCPTGAIHPREGTVDKRACIACLGCVNNCPAQAVRMRYMGRTVEGWVDFKKRHRLP